MNETLSSIAYYAVYQLQEILEDIPDSKEKKRTVAFCDNIIMLISAEYPDQFQSDANLYKYSGCIKRTIESCVSGSKWANKMDWEMQQCLKCIALLNVIASCVNGVTKSDDLYIIKFRQRFVGMKDIFEKMELKMIPCVSVDTKTMGVFTLHFVKQLNNRFQKMEKQTLNS